MMTSAEAGTYARLLYAPLHSSGPSYDSTDHSDIQLRRPHWQAAVVDSTRLSLARRMTISGTWAGPQMYCRILVLRSKMIFPFPNFVNGIAHGGTAGWGKGYYSSHHRCQSITYVQDLVGGREHRPYQPTAREHKRTRRDGEWAQRNPHSRLLSIQ